MTDDHAPFFAAIAAQPGAAAPRLIYADWLEEQGDTARAEAWRWLVKEKRQPGQMKLAAGYVHTSSRPGKSYQKSMTRRTYCWASTMGSETTYKRWDLDRYGLTTTCLLPLEVYAQLMHHHGTNGSDFGLLIYEFITALDAELAAAEAVADLIREDTQHARP